MDGQNIGVQTLLNYVIILFDCLLLHHSHHKMEIIGWKRR